MEKLIITCDVLDCGKEGFAKVECCHGWQESDEQYGVKTKYKKFEKPLTPEKTDLCKEHYQEWSKKTCRVLRMDKERKR